MSELKQDRSRIKYKNTYEYEFDYTLLRDKINRRFGNITTFCSFIGMSKQQFSAKLNGTIGFTPKDILNLCDALDIDKIDIGAFFFTLKLIDLSCNVNKVNE